MDVVGLDPNGSVTLAQRTDEIGGHSRVNGSSRLYNDIDYKSSKSQPLGKFLSG